MGVRRAGRPARRGKLPIGDRNGLYGGLLDPRYPCAPIRSERGIGAVAHKPILFGPGSHSPETGRRPQVKAGAGGAANGSHAWRSAARAAIRTGLRTRDTLGERFFGARAWYWATRVHVDRNRAGWEGLANLRAEWREAVLREFVSNEDIDVRRCILSGLPFITERYPADLHLLVAEAIRIARTHPDEYLRHRVELQTRS